MYGEHDPYIAQLLVPRNEGRDDQIDLFSEPPVTPEDTRNWLVIAASVVIALLAIALLAR